MAIKTWKKVTVSLHGTTPLKIDSPKCVNPTHTIAKELKRITSKGAKRTEKDHVDAIELQWLAAVWCDDDVECCDAYMSSRKPNLTGAQVYIPAEYVEGAIVNGLKAISTKVAKTTQNNFVRVLEERIPLQHAKSGVDLHTLWKDENFRDVRIVATKTGEKMLKCVPRFNQWELECTVEYNVDVVNEAQFYEAVVAAGALVGIGAHRKKYGRFNVKAVADIV